MRPASLLEARATQPQFHGPKASALFLPAIQPGLARPLPGAMPAKRQQRQARTERPEFEKQPGVYASKNVPRRYAENAIFIGRARDPSTVDLAKFSREQQVCPGAINDVCHQGCIAGEAGIPALPGCLVGAPQFAPIGVIKARAYIGLERGSECEFG